MTDEITCTHEHTYSVWIEDSLDGYYKTYCESCDEFQGNEF